MRSHAATLGLRWRSIVLVYALLPTAAWAQAEPMAEPQTEAPTADVRYEALIDRALAEFDARRFTEARSLFEEAHALQPTARTLRGLGLTAFEQRRYDLAHRELQAAMGSTLRPLTPVQRVEIGELLAWMETNLGTLELSLSPPNAAALVDDHEHGPGRVLLDPGEHRLLVRAEGYRSEARAFTLELDRPLALRVELQRAVEAVAAPPARLPSGPPPDEPREGSSSSIFERWWFWTAVGVIVVGGVATALALTLDSEPDYEPGGVGGVVRTLRVRP
jgi:tetratricopeptide (TPR) repeat protein